MVVFRGCAKGRYRTADTRIFRRAVPTAARAWLRQLTRGMGLAPTKVGLVAEMILTGKRLAAVGGVRCANGAGGGIFLVDPVRILLTKAP